MKDYSINKDRDLKNSVIQLRELLFELVKKVNYAYQ